MTSGSRQKVLLALAVGLAGVVAILPRPVLEFEESAGLDWLFRLRGAVEAPAGIAVISIDSESASALGLKLDAEDWPRAFHAETVRRVTDAGAAATVFDVSFQEEHDAEGDEALAEAIRRAGNVLLLDWLDRESVQVAVGHFETEERMLPIAPLADAALGTAPFPLPAHLPMVSQFWAFGRVDSEAITLPSAALHAYAIPAHDDLLGLLEDVRPGSSAMLPRAAELSPARKLTSASRLIRRLFLHDRNLARDLSSRLTELREAEGPRGTPDRWWLVERLIALYGGPNSHYLNFYGPARTIPTIPYHRVLSMDPAAAREAFAGKVVFIGFSEMQSDDQQDEFETVYSEKTGTDLGGVEIGATAYANLLHGTPVRPLALPLQLAIVLAWGSALVCALLWLPTRLGVLTSVLAGPAYVFVALRLFTTGGVWLPLIVPVFGQIPLALIGVLAWQYAQARQQGDRVRRALASYLPTHAVDELSRRVGATHPASQLLHGTCLVTDAQNYTALAERLPPQELQKALNAYYAVLFPEVERRGGFVSDVVGDSMVAIWATPEPDAAARLNACRAALAIQQATRTYNRTNVDIQLPTRIGIHAGQILLGDVGTQSHREYRAIGDIVNTASRIQDLNKQLRTTLLVSEDVLQDAAAASFRRLGEFLLPGKAVPIRLCDRISIDPNADAQQSVLIGCFDEAHRLFLARRWSEAAAGFERLLARFPADGPSEFFLKLCYRCAAQDPGSAWTGTVTAAVP